MKEIRINSVSNGVKYPQTPFLVRGKFSKALFICTSVVKDSDTHFILTTVTTESVNKALLLSCDKRMARDYDIVDGPVTLENIYA